MDTMINYEKRFLKTDIPEFRPGDIVQVYYKIKEEERVQDKKGKAGSKGERERIQVFQGIVIKIQNTGLSKAFTVRKISYSIGVERTFPLHSPNIESIKIVKRGKIRWSGKIRKIRRSKLYYLRKEEGKGTKM